MDAFIEIIEKLVESVPGQTWLEQNHFPFKSLQSPKARVFDVCLFETNAHGAYGFLWIEFQDSDDLLIFPFSLARYKEDGDLISLTPWSLRNASSDNNFYESWRTAQKQRNPLLTARKGNFHHTKYSGEPSFIAMNIWSDPRNTCVRLDFQIAYKIFRTLEKGYPQSIEVEFLSYLGNQSIFTNFAKLTSVFEYSSKDIPKSHIAIGMRYIPNNGVLFPHFVSLLHKARFPKKLKERSSAQSWQELLRLTESLGRLLGDFHKAMSLVPRHSELAPEQSTKSLRAHWLKIVLTKLDERLNKVLALQKFYPNFSGIFYLLPDYINKMKESIENLEDIGLRIRIHGNFHLGHILIGAEDPVLLDYDADDFDDTAYRRIKQPCLKDVVSMIIGLRFAWYFTERKYYSLLSDKPENLDMKSFTSNSSKGVNQSINSDRQQPSLQELEKIFLKFYKNSLDESITSLELRPKNPAKEKVLFNFCFLMRILKEIARELPEGNPRPRLWLYILQDFMMSENSA
ncbi:MAG: hypothetical protein V4591_02490 [Bdellovibrionota bacterium]